MWPTTEAILDGTVYLLLANTSGSFLLNGVTTCFIAIRLWQQVKFLRQNLEPEMRNSFKLWRVLFLLVDSGAIYGTLQFVYPALTIALIQGQSSIAGIHSTVSHVRGLSDSRGAELEVSKLKDHEHLETDPV
ncbi:hypothetical protein H0H93_002995 [Arthromyces matolae]|nr:hypothetical protein H0H93_002995 [Arthromyces matolae]